MRFRPQNLHLLGEGLGRHTVSVLNVTASGRAASQACECLKVSTDLDFHQNVEYHHLFHIHDHTKILN
ncbi:hypothetical protein MKW92_053231 [Papaver armeniacum]|nr:hypothetical protein MKW92_053231 [Papaver armeniacum]